MKVIERFSNIERVRRATNAIKTIIKYGNKGVSKVNPTILVFDAAYSMIECGIAYLDYKREKNKYYESLNRLKIIKFEYESKRKIIEEDLKAYKIEIELVADNLLDEIKKQREILEKHFEIVLGLKEGLVILKKIYLESNELENLEKVINLQTAFIEMLIK